MPEHRQKFVLAPVGVDELLDPQSCLAQSATMWRDAVHSAAVYSVVPGNAGQNGRPGSPGHYLSHSPSRPGVAVVGSRAGGYRGGETRSVRYCTYAAGYAATLPTDGA